MTKQRKPPKRPLTKEEKELWQQFTSKAIPLDQVPKPPPLSTEANRRPRTPLKKDKHPIPTARLDLHGMTIDQAFQSLTTFLANSQAQGHRCVLVITGKGSVKTEHWWQKAGILKEQVPRWLEDEPNRSRITTHSIARPEHGGSGALYVFLKKIKPYALA